MTYQEIRDARTQRRTPSSKPNKHDKQFYDIFDARLSEDGTMLGLADIYNPRPTGSIPLMRWIPIDCPLAKEALASPRIKRLLAKMQKSSPKPHDIVEYSNAS